MRIRTRLSLMLLVIVGLGFYVLADWLLDDLKPRYLESMEESMVDTSTMLASLLSVQAGPGGISTHSLGAALDEAARRRFSARIYELTKSRVEMRVYVTDARGTVIFDSDAGRDEGRDYSRWNDVMLTLRGEYGARTTRTDPDDPSTAILHVASPIRANGDIVGCLTVCKPAGSLTFFVQTARRKILFVSVLAGLIIIGLATLTSFWITRPIQRLTTYARAVRDGRRVSLPRLGRGEVGDLGSAFEEMRDVVEGRHYVERYVRDLTHAMKSPLSSISGAAELLEEDLPPESRARFTANVRTETERLRDLVDRLLELAALETRKQLRDIERVNLKRLADEIVASLAPQAEARGLRIEVHGEDNIVIRGERFPVRQSIANLLQNALDFSPDGAAIALVLRRRGRYVDVCAADRGPGIPDYALERAFDHFYSLQRPRTGRKSSGLGLPLVRGVALLHGGRARLANRPAGGTLAVMRLPVSGA